jgi:hypothetical protein
MDGDGSHRPNEIAMIRRKLDAGALVVKGSRFLPGGGTNDMTVLRKLGNLLFVLLFRLAGFDITDLCYGFIGFRRSFWRHASPVSSSLAFDVNLVVKGLLFDKKSVVEFPSFERKRSAGWAKSNAIRTGMEVFKSIVDAFWFVQHSPRTWAVSPQTRRSFLLKRSVNIRSPFKAQCSDRAR